MTTQARPAFYALAPGGWRDYATLLHPPYTLWHLSYVAIGATLAPHLHPWRLAATAAAFFLAVGIGAHALDELNGRPLQTRIPAATLLGLAVVSIAGAVAIGIAAAIELAWGGFPLLTGYFAQAHRIRVEALAAAVFATLLSLAQRRLSTQVRLIRRRVRSVSGTIELDDGRREAITRETLRGAPEAALRLLAASTLALAAALLVLRLA